MRILCHAALLRTAFAALSLFGLAGPSRAIDGGAVAGQNALTEATVGVGTLVSDEESVGLNRCSGVLISPVLVLTAAHCVKDNPLASAVILYRGAKPVPPAIRVKSLVRYDISADDLPPDVANLVELSLDTAVLRLASPVRGRRPIPIGHGRTPPAGLRLAGAGLSAEGVGVLKTTHLDPVAVTATGLILAKTRGSGVCRGDSGGPVVADGPRGPVLWGVASAVLTQNGNCGRVVVIAPATPNL